MPQLTFAPWPLCAALAIANDMIRRREPRLSLLTAVAADVYMRPGAFAGPRTENTIPGRPELGPAHRHWSILAHRSELGQKANKVGAFNESIRLDPVGKGHLTIELIKVYRQLLNGQDRCDSTMAEWTAMWNRCRDSLGLPKAPVCMLRHIGAPYDIPQCKRGERSVQDRGDWTAAPSMCMYEKAGAILAVLSGMTPGLASHVRQCDKLLPQHLTAAVLPIVFRK